MSDGEYNLDGDESNFAKIVSLEIILIQLLRELIHNSDDTDKIRIIEGFRKESEFVNNRLNHTDSGRDRAWKAEMSKTFSMIYDTAFNDIKFGAEG